MKYVAIIAMGLALGSCASIRVDVRDRQSGVAVVHAQAVAMRGANPPEVLAQADSAGRLSLPISDDPTLILGVRADGYVLWSKPAAHISGGPHRITVDLEPAWMTDFLRTGKKPSDLPAVKGCDCPGKRSH